MRMYLYIDVQQKKIRANLSEINRRAEQYVAFMSRRVTNKIKQSVISSVSKKKKKVESSQYE